MTDKEIIQALRCCANEESDDCPFAGHGVCGCPGVSADLIERLTAENAALREQVPQWISVEDADKLPEWGQRVLITDGVFVGEGFLTGKVFFGFGESSQWKRYDNTPWKNPMKTEITHWMPLPGAPEKGGKHGTTDNP